MEDAVRDKEAMARAGELTAGVAHEVRNGLGTILGYARLIERGASPEEVGGRGATDPRGVRDAGDGGSALRGVRQDARP